MWYVIGISLILLTVLVILSLFRNTSRRRFVCKVLTSLSFIALAVVIMIEKEIAFTNSYCRSLLIAFVLSTLGDFALGQNHLDRQIVKKDKFFWKEIGTVLFGLAQITFIITFLKEFEFNILYSLIPLFGVMLMIYIVSKLKVFDKKRSILIFVYTFFLTSMVASTFNAANELNYNPLGIVIMIAGLSFAVSDFTLIFKYYYHKYQVLTTIVSCVTYYVAQLLFAFSIFFIL